MKDNSSDRDGVTRRGRRRPLSIDAHVGNRLRTRRVLAGKSQTELGNALGLTFQQIQKYEKGANRISAGHLYLFARALDCTPNDFFEGLRRNGEDGQASEVQEFLLSDEAIKLCQAFAGLDSQTRKAILDLTRSLPRALEGSTRSGRGQPSHPRVRSRAP